MTVPFQLKIPKDIHKEIKKKAIDAGYTMHQYILDCITYAWADRARFKESAEKEYNFKYNYKASVPVEALAKCDAVSHGTGTAIEEPTEEVKDFPCGQRKFSEGAKNLKDPSKHMDIPTSHLGRKDKPLGITKKDSMK